MVKQLFILAIMSISLSACNISGSASKGPFKSGTTVSASKLNSLAIPIASTTINTQVSDDQGRFSVNRIQWDGWAELTVEGQYFDEFTNSDSSESIVLSTITRKDRRFDSANVHLFSHFAAARIKNRVDNGQNRINAWRDTQTEIQQLFGLTKISRNIHRGVEQLDPAIGSGRYRRDNANLLLFTGSFLASGGNSLSLQSLTEDFADDGQFNGIGFAIFNNIAIAGNTQGLLESLSQNLTANGARNPPNNGDMQDLPIWVVEDSTPINQTPIAEDQNITVDAGSFDNLITITGTDADGDSLTYETNEPSNGLLTGIPPNVSYTPNAEFIGSDSFTFTVSDGLDTSVSATISIAVNEVIEPNNAPIANAQGITVDAGSFDNLITLTGSDADGDSLTYDTSEPDNGSLSGTAPNISYTPNAEFIGSDSFTFTVSDGLDTSLSATVNIRVNEVILPNNIPVANPQSVTVDAGSFENLITLTGSDADGDILTYDTSEPGNGSLSGTPPNLSYTPSPEFIGEDSFTFTVSDGLDTSVSANVNITVNEVIVENNTPIANPQSVTVDAGSFDNLITLTGSDADGDILTYDASEPVNGSLSGTAPNISYTPDAEFIGTDSFTFTVSDGLNTSLFATINILVESPAAPNVQGRVRTSEGRLLDDISIRALSVNSSTPRETISSNFGRYSLALDYDANYILVIESEGYATQVIPIKTLESTTINTDVILLEDGDSFDFDGATGIQATAEYGASVDVPASSFLDNSIKLTITPLNTSFQSNEALLPGSGNALFSGSGTPSIVNILGAVEFDFINVVTNEKADLSGTATIKIPLFNLARLDGTTLVAGDSVPLLSLDEVSGQWVQEGFAIVEESTDSQSGFVAVGQVNHFSWWSLGFDAPPGNNYSAYASITVNPAFSNQAGAVTLRARTSADVSYNPESSIQSFNIGETINISFPGYINTTTCFWAEILVDGTSAPFVTAEQCIAAPIIGETYDLLFSTTGNSTFQLFQIPDLKSVLGYDDSAGSYGIQPASFSNEINVSYAITGGALPPGVALTQSGLTTGLISGIPTAAGRYEIEITAVDSDNNVRFLPFEFIVVDPLTDPAFVIGDGPGTKPNSFAGLETGYNTWDGAAILDLNATDPLNSNLTLELSSLNIGVAATSWEIIDPSISIAYVDVDGQILAETTPALRELALAVDEGITITNSGTLSINRPVASTYLSYRFRVRASNAMGSDIISVLLVYDATSRWYQSYWN